MVTRTIKAVLLGLVGIFVIIQLHCAGTKGGIESLPQPKPNMIMLIGDILLENIDQNFIFDYWDLPLKVVILGRTEDGNINHYVVTTDNKGYYCLPNVPKGSYLIKAIIFQEPGKIPNIIVNDWDNIDSKYYLMRHPERGVEYKASWFPHEQESRIINQHIRWFGLKKPLAQDMVMASIGEVFVNTYSKNLKTERLWTDGHLYTREEPLTYFKKKFPNSGWWK